MRKHRSMQTRQQGGSTIGTILFLAILAYVIFVAIQYVPQHIESSTVSTMLDTISEQHGSAPMDTMRAVNSAIDNQLFVNQMGDLRDSFKVTQYRGDFVITVQYERELNLLYENKKMPFEKTVTLTR